MENSLCGYSLCGGHGDCGSHIWRVACGGRSSYDGDSLRYGAGGLSRKTS